jgi:hypothetical protein
MKNLFQESTYTFIFLFALITSLTFISCGDEDKNVYTNEIQKADALFTGQKYKEAKVVYGKALVLKKGEVYPTEQIHKIDALLFARIEDSYSSKIKEADAFLGHKEYDKAKRVYLDASSIKPNEAYPKTKINEIESAISVKENDLVESKPFHIIAGSYAIKTNATAFQKSILSEGRKSMIIRSSNGNYLVSLNSLETITEAYNYLSALDSDSDSTIWVYKN